MAERQGLTLGAGAAVPGARPRLTTPVPRAATPAAGAPTQVRIVRPNIPKLAPVQPRKPKEEDKGLLGRIIGVPVSGVKAIAQGVSAIPQFVGKTAQTAYGLGEGVVDLGLDLIDEDIFKSRFETDLDRARELGLEGDELVAFAAQRQYPLGSMIVQSGAATGRRVAEVATAGKYNYGEPGIDYATAWRKGDLGSFLVEDVGNVILAGRAVGAGNVVARAGQAVPGRTGRAIATTGRLIEEPVATTTRGLATGAARIAPRLPEPLRPIAGPAERVGQAERPIRQITQELGNTYRNIQTTRQGKLDVDIAALIGERDAASARGATEEAQRLQGRIDELNDRRDKTTAGTGILKYGRGIVKAGTIESERRRQNLIYQFNRLVDRGAAPESVEVYRARATRLRDEAAQATDPQIKATKYAQATAADNLAAIKEQYGADVDQPLPSYVQEAAIHFATGKAFELARQAEDGATPEQLVRAASDPTVGPDLAQRGMQPTTEGVLAAIEYVRSRRGQDTSLNPAQVFMVDSMYALMKEWSDWANTMMAQGKGMPQGPAPFYWFQPFPIPEYVLDALENASGADKNAITGVLDEAVVYLINGAIDSGQFDADIWQTLKINPEEPTNAWTKLAKAGVAAIKKGDTAPENILEHQLAFYAMQGSYRALRNVAPDFMLNPDIYPATMRPMIITRRQAVRRVTGEDVQRMADVAMDLARNYNEIIPGNVLEGISRDIGKAVDPRQRVNKKVWDGIQKRIATVRDTAAKRAEELRKVEGNLSAADQNLLAQLDDIANTVFGIETTIQSIVATAPKPSPRLIRARREVTETQAAQAEAQQGLEAVQAAIDEQEAGRQVSLQPVREEVGRLSQLVNERASNLDDVNTQITELETAIAEMQPALDELNRLEAEGITEETLRADLALAEAYRERVKVSRVTDARARETKAAEVALREQDVTRAYGDLDDLMGGMRFIRGYSADDPRYGQRDGGVSFLETEDNITGLEQGMIGDKDRGAAVSLFIEEFSDYNRGVSVDEMASVYNDATGRDLSTSDYLREVGSAFVRIREAEAAQTAAQKKPLRLYKEDIAKTDADQFDFDVTEQTQTGFGLEMLRKLVALLNPQVRADVVRRIQVARRDLDQARQRAAQDRQSVDALRSQLRDAEGLLVPRAPKELVAERQRLATAERVARKTLSVRRGQLTRLEKGEPRRAIEEERRALRPVAEIARPAAGAEGPVLGRIRPSLARGVSKTIGQLERKQRTTVSRLREVRNRLATQDELVGAAQEGLELVQDLGRQRLVGVETPLGPELLREGEAPLYIPAGPARGMLPGRDVQLQIRGEGAGPQTRLQAAQQRTSGAFVLTADGLASRINEVLGQIYRNSIVENLITDSKLANTVVGHLGQERFDRMFAEAQRDADAQVVDRTASEYDAAVQQALGERIMRQLELDGYEVVSPVKIDPNTGGHEPVGDLSLSVTPRTVDENSIVMRKGVASRMFSEFERKGAREIPIPLERVINSIGDLTARWKSHILPISMRWQIGDAVGIVLFAWLRGDIPPAQLAARIREAVGRITDPNDPRLGQIFVSDLIQQQFADPVLAAGFGNALQARGLRMEEREFLERHFSRLTGTREEVGRLGPYDRFRAKAFRINETINGLGRAAVFIDNLDRVLTQRGRSLDEITGPNTINDPVITEAIQQAVEATNQTLGAFSDLTPWEKQVMRKVFPFWSWIKFINKAAYELAIDQPDRVLFYAHLGSMATDPDNNELGDWLRGKTPIMGALYDLNFLNPYQDAFLFKGNPLTASAETFTSFSPALTFPAQALNELYYAQTGRQLPLPGPRITRPGYLEGRPEATTRGLGDVLGGIGYMGLTQLGGPLRNVLTMLPEGQIPLTDVATGPVQRFGQGSLRTTGAYAEPRLGPVTGRLAALGRTFGVPSPLIEEELAQQQAADQRQRDIAARQRRIIERQQAGA